MPYLNVLSSPGTDTNNMLDPSELNNYAPEDVILAFEFLRKTEELTKEMG